MKAYTLFIGLLSFALMLSSIFDLLFRVVAFVKEHYIPKRDFRLVGFKTKVVCRIAEVIHSFKSWMYAMFSRWHVDSLRLA